MAAENHLLTLLDSATRSELKPHMRTITVEHGEMLHGSSSEIQFAYFPQSTIVSVLARTEQGQTAHLHPQQPCLGAVTLSAPEGTALEAVRRILNAECHHPRLARGATRALDRQEFCGPLCCSRPSSPS
jgi:hypothetical protein